MHLHPTYAKLDFVEKREIDADFKEWLLERGLPVKLIALVRYVFATNARLWRALIIDESFG